MLLTGNAKLVMSLMESESAGVAHNQPAVSIFVRRSVRRCEDYLTYCMYNHRNYVRRQRQMLKSPVFNRRNPLVY